MLLRKIEEDQALYPKVFIKNKGSKVHKSKGTAISTLSKPTTEVFISSPSLLKKSASILPPTSTENVTKVSTTLQTHSTVSSSVQPQLS